MDVQSVLEASFPTPVAVPDWQSDLLFRLGATDLLCQPRERATIANLTSPNPVARR